jgi:Ca2+/Na+ antiporter
MKKFEKYTLIIVLVFFYFLFIGLLTWQLRLGAIILTLILILYVKFMIKMDSKYNKDSESN